MSNVQGAEIDGRLRPSSANPRYWQYRGEPVLLLGGTVDDNVFQIPDLEAHLDLLRQVGGNYVRNTMSDRPDNGYEIKAFARRADGLYDLHRWNEQYWQRFEDLLRLSAERQIFVQIEVWDRFDHSREPWLEDPFNPKNNINYTSAESGLEEQYPEHPGGNGQPFFYTVPALRDNRVVLPFQQAFVDRMLAHSLRYDHVLYCMDNETSGDPEWGRYWAEYIRRKAREAGVEVELTEMWDSWDVRHEAHRPTLDHPGLYSFVDLSQNSHQTGQPNWDNAQWVRQYIAARPRPVNSTKIYGADTSKWTGRGIDDEHGTRTFWRNIIGGFASSRFHRPPSGLGLSEKAQAHIRSARMLADTFDFLRAEPDGASALLRGREPDQAYLTRVRQRQYALYFTDGRKVGLDLGGEAGTFALRWLDIRRSRWLEGEGVAAGGVVEVEPPEPGSWVALLSREE